MDQNDRIRPAKGDGVAPSRLLLAPELLVEQLYALACASRWELSREHFRAALERSSQKRFAAGELTGAKLEEYLAALHLEDLALASACMQGCESAWEYFVSTYRSYLRSAAAAILRSSPGSANACELADSLFAELYGLADGRRGTASLFRYFHGRSSLKTWLRAVLAQRHVDGIRATRRFDSLDDEGGAAERRQKNSVRSSTAPAVGPLAIAPDPYREKYIALFCSALQGALQRLDAADRRRVCLYYAEGKKLAEVGRLCGEHESSVSRNLERIRRELRT